MVIEWLLMVIKPIVISLYLVGGAITILKNDGVRHWEGWHPIYEMENKKIKHVWSHQPHLRPNCTRPHQEWCSRMGLTSFPSDGPEIRERIDVNGVTASNCGRSGRRPTHGQCCDLFTCLKYWLVDLVAIGTSRDVGLGTSTRIANFKKKHSQ